MIKNFLGLIYGIAFGMALLVPGFSGGTLLIIFGCYDKVSSAMALDFKAIKANLLFLALFGLGAIAGVLGAIFAITDLSENFPIQTKLLFIGLILGGLPLITKLATAEKKFSLMCIPPFIAGLAVIVGIALIGNPTNVQSEAGGSVNAILLGVYSAVAGIALIIPGISGAFMLSAFGVYDTIVPALKGALKMNFEWGVVVPALIGILSGVIIGAKLVVFLLKKSKLMVYSVIIGMVAGSVFALFPSGFGANTDTYIGIACLAAGAATAFLLGKITKSE